MATYNATMPGEYIYVVAFTHRLYQENDVLLHLAIDGFSGYCFKPHCEPEFSYVGFATNLISTIAQIIEWIPHAEPNFIFGYGAEILYRDYPATDFPFIYDPIEANRFALPVIEKFKKIIFESL